MDSQSISAHTCIDFQMSMERLSDSFNSFGELFCLLQADQRNGQILLNCQGCMYWIDGAK